MARTDPNDLSDRMSIFPPLILFTHHYLPGMPVYSVRLQQHRAAHGVSGVGRGVRVSIVPRLPSTTLHNIREQVSKILLEI